MRAAVLALLLPLSAEAGCLGLETASGECLERMPTVAEVTAMEHEAPRTPDLWRQCLAAGEASEICPEFVFYRGRFEHTEDAIAKQKMSIIVWQTARAAFRCEGSSFDRLSGLIAGNFSGVDGQDHAALLPALQDMRAHVRGVCG
ncbi:MAG: hypothetical protein AAFR17_12005 [Pseudomonadota bacterium]